MAPRRAPRASTERNSRHHHPCALSSESDSSAPPDEAAPGTPSTSSFSPSTSPSSGDSDLDYPGRAPIPPPGTSARLSRSPMARQAPPTPYNLRPRANIKRPRPFGTEPQGLQHESKRKGKKTPLKRAQKGRFTGRVSQRRPEGAYGEDSGGNSGTSGNCIPGPSSFRPHQPQPQQPFLKRNFFQLSGLVKRKTASSSYAGLNGPLPPGFVRPPGDSRSRLAEFRRSRCKWLRDFAKAEQKKARELLKQMEILESTADQWEQELDEEEVEYEEVQRVQVDQEEGETELVVDLNSSIPIPRTLNLESNVINQSTAIATAASVARFGPNGIEFPEEDFALPQDYFDLCRRPPDVEVPPPILHPENVQNPPVDFEDVVVPPEDLDVGIPPDDMQAPPEDEGIPPANADVVVPPQDMEIPAADIQAPPQNRKIPPQNMEILFQNLEIPLQNLEIPPQNLEIPPQNLEIPLRNVKTPQNVETLPRNPEIPPQNLERAPQNGKRSKSQSKKNLSQNLETPPPPPPPLNVELPSSSPVWEFPLRNFICPSRDDSKTAPTDMKFPIVRLETPPPDTKIFPLVDLDIPPSSADLLLACPKLKIPSPDSEAYLTSTDSSSPPALLPGSYQNQNQFKTESIKSFDSTDTTPMPPNNSNNGGSLNYVSSPSPPSSSVSSRNYDDDFDDDVIILTPSEEEPDAHFINQGPFYITID